MFVTRHADVAERVARLRAFGVDRSHGERSVPGMYDVPSLGLNYRMSELQAALGRTQLARIQENLARRRANFARLRDAVSGLSAVRLLDAAHADATSSHYCATVLLGGLMAPRRTELMASLTEAGVGTSIYYPHPVPRMAYYRTKYGYDANRFHQAAAISDASIALPVGPHLEQADVDHVATIVRATLGAVQQ